MAFMEKIRDVSRSVAARSGELAESSKLTITIKKKERDIKSLERKIGSMVYDAYKKGHTFGDELSAECQKIDEAYTEITRLEEEKGKVGLDDLSIEVVDLDAAVPQDEDFEVSEEDDEILREL